MYNIDGEIKEKVEKRSDLFNIVFYRLFYRLCWFNELRIDGLVNLSRL